MSVLMAIRQNYSYNPIKSILHPLTPLLSSGGSSLPNASTKTTFIFLNKKYTFCDKSLSLQYSICKRLVVWHRGSVIRRMNEVTLRWARLVLGWVTVFGQVYYLGM